MRPIDADDLLEIIEKYCGGYDCHDSESFDKTAVRMAIRSAPTLSLWDVAGQCALTAGRYMPAEIAIECFRNANLGGVLKDAAECLIHIAEQSAVAQGQAPAAVDGLRTDLISREAAMRLALRCYRDAQQNVKYCYEREDDFGTMGFSGQREAFRWMAMALLALPAAEAEPRLRGGWIGVSDGEADMFPVYDHWECSVCGHTVDGEDYGALSLYCPACGARMSGGDAEGGGGAAAE